MAPTMSVRRSAGWTALTTLSLGRKSVVEQNKEAYYLALRQTQGTIRTEAPNWQPWLTFFLRSLAEQVRRLEKKVEVEKLVLAALPELSLQIRICPRARPRHHRRRHQTHWGQPQHAQAAFPCTGRARQPQPARRRSRCLVRTTLIGMPVPLKMGVEPRVCWPTSVAEAH
jgi:hypothetical protein